MIRLRIRELVLHGFARRDRAAVTEAVRGELARMLSRTDATPESIDKRVRGSGPQLGRSVVHAVKGGRR